MVVTLFHFPKIIQKCLTSNPLPANTQNGRVAGLFITLFQKSGFKSKPPKKPGNTPLFSLYLSFLDSKQTVSTWLDRSGLMSVIRNLSRLIWYVPKYLRLFVETYPQILWQKYLDTFCYPYRCLNLARPRKKFNFFIRFYYYSDSNIKVKFCEDPPSSQPCPFFLQRTGQRLF